MILGSFLGIQSGFKVTLANEITWNPTKYNLMNPHSFKIIIYWKWYWIYFDNNGIIRIQELHIYFLSTSVLWLRILTNAAVEVWLLFNISPVSKYLYVLSRCRLPKQTPKKMTKWLITLIPRHFYIEPRYYSLLWADRIKNSMNYINLSHPLFV